MKLSPYFPNISHVHYGKIAKIVKETAQECNAFCCGCSFQTFRNVGIKRNGLNTALVICLYAFHLR
jgi:hypothetical protein